MKLYYHKTDGGAEYYCTQPIKGTDEGDMKTAILRTDGNELEINTYKLAQLGLAVIIKS
jgi:hypothetical protein